eukprot:1863743-Pyramimonas_sp.AAC.1
MSGDKGITCNVNKCISAHCPRMAAPKLQAEAVAMALYIASGSALWTDLGSEFSPGSEAENIAAPTLTSKRSTSMVPSSLEMVSFQYSALGYLAGLFFSALGLASLPRRRVGPHGGQEGLCDAPLGPRTGGVVSSRDIEIHAAPFHICDRGGTGLGEDDDHRH